MAKLNDLTGKTFGEWQVLYRNGSTPNKASVWRCKCLLCGKEKDIVGYSLSQGKTTKCRSCSTKQWQEKEYSSKDPVYVIYSGMKQRCYDKNNSHYYLYGGRGISVCDEWKTDFQAFAKWAYENGYQKGLSIDRIEVNGNYEPSNCRFITNSEQQRNKRSNHYVVVNGETLCLNQACSILNIHVTSVYSYQKKNNCTYQEAIEHFIA